MIISIDPSSTKAGYAIFDKDGNLLKYGAIKNCNLKDNGLGLSTAMAGFARVLYSGPYVIDTIVCEKMFVRPGMNSKLPLDCQFSAGIIVGTTVGVVNSMAKIESSGINIISVTPRSWQSHVIGKMVDEHGNKRSVEKSDIRAKAAALYGDKFTNDVADAVCIGYWYLTKGRAH